MKRASLFVVALLCTAAFFAGSVAQKPARADESIASAPSKLGVLWTSGDRDVALRMVFMYTFHAKQQGWWEDIRLIVWGPSSKLLAEDSELQAEVAKMQDIGVEFVACKACADSYGVSEKLEALGIEVKYMGTPLTDMLKGDWVTVTF
jgi:hypothetical protein